MSIELKIKAKHLALEPAIIKHEIKKLGKQISWIERNTNEKDIWSLVCKQGNLQSHLDFDVKLEARATHLIRAMIAGTSYSRVENTKSMEYGKGYKYFAIRQRMVRMYKKYISRTATDEFAKAQIEQWFKS